MASASSVRAQQILERVRAVPEGFVRTYGDISPGAPRLAGAVLSACGDPSLPWHRVVRADGSLAKGSRQRRRLEREGVPFRGERVLMRIARLPPDAILAPVGAFMDGARIASMDDARIASMDGAWIASVDSA